MINKLDNMNKPSYNELLKSESNERINVLKEFLDDNTIDFIIDNNDDFINKIPINSLLKSANYFTSIDNFDYKNLVKWFPIVLDYDRFNIIIDYLKSENIPEDEIVEYIEKSINKDFELADKLYENKYKEMTNTYLKTADDLKPFINKSKVNNETFNNLLNNNIEKYDNLLRRLK